ncbi:hypothetical protein BO82DRAFT_399670 [Aspergillus uvarum CBS 121591]|uniref:Uncharacterized protein n=1 Tax=Aspergillus uvarum CBS 121591 TaxID=1448315 RepID=A0A319CMY4_9EURO|nr:hypothetical protein BO82DRAFT_399670 [Aspergillus uvarum CBS 121591]PYH84427.1 hypothetical protein BO82DRAFT_399670 [Aspergillus uvarum CBS 121591]
MIGSGWKSPSVDKDGYLMLAVDSGNNTYSVLRVIRKGYDLFCSFWCTNKHKLDDLTSNPCQLSILCQTPKTEVLGYERTKVISRLDALLLLLESCDVHSAPHRGPFSNRTGPSPPFDKLNPKYGAFYAAQPSISFAACDENFPDLERPQQGCT